MTQSISQKYSSPIELQNGERITKSEDRHLSNTQLNDLQIQRFHLLKDKFEHQQPIDTVFGITKKNAIHRSIKSIPFLYRSSTISI